jgi:SAM-dependent methyltransferase
MLPNHFGDFPDAVSALQHHLGELTDLKVLDAGCGARSHLHLQACHITGIDLSPRQLEHNGQLHLAVHGDIQRHSDEAWRESFDLIVCWDVLEHLPDPSAALENMIGWLAPQGRLVVAFPIYESFKGRVTKYTPFSVHNLFYFLTSPKAFFAGVKPFPTCFDPSIRIRCLAQFMERIGLAIELAISVESYQNKLLKSVLGSRLVDWLNRLCLGAALSHFSPGATDLILVLRKTGSGAAEPPQSAAAE